MINFNSYRNDLEADLAIASVELIRDRSIKGVGRETTSLVHFNDQSTFVIRKNEPRNQQYPYIVDFSPPLATRVDGFNSLFAHDLSRSGQASRLIGTDQTTNHSLKHAALASQLIIEQDDLETSTPTKSSILCGYSMGAMRGLGQISLSQNMSHQYPVAIFIDPCLAQPLKLSPAKAVNLVTYCIKEIVNAASHVSRNFSNQSEDNISFDITSLLKSISLSPKFIANTLDKLIMLSGGESGKMARNLNPTSLVAIHFFNKSQLNDQATYMHNIDPMSNVTFISENGYHLDGINRTFLAHYIANLVQVQKLLQMQATADSIREALNVNYSA